MEHFEKYMQQRDYSRKTIASMSNGIRLFMQWIEKQNIEQDQVSYNDVLAYIKYCTKKGNKKATINAYLGGVKHYYDSLIENGKASNNPIGVIRVRGERKRIIHDTFTIEEQEAIYNNFHQKGITGKRNKIILGLIIYQALRTGELENLEPKDINLRQGKIFIAGGRKTAERELKLESHQVIDIQEYITETRKVLLIVSEKESPKLFVSTGQGKHFTNITDKLLKALKKQHARIKNLDQLRVSTIVNWLRVHNLRRAQYMAGHKYISSTERYQLSHLDDLKEDINKYHPINEIK